jgi:hypothetical protein
VVWLTRRPEYEPPKGDDKVVRFDTRLTPSSLVGIGLFLALLDGDVEHGETVLCLLGEPGSRRLSTLTLASPQRQFPWLSTTDLEAMRRLGATRHLARLLEIALRLAAEGREGRPIGTALAFVSRKSAGGHVRQLILNPVAGHPEEERSIHNPDFFETLRELSALDGGFVIDEDGIVRSAGTYFDAPADGVRLRRGLGARHAAARALTAVSDAFVIVVSESSGDVTVFHGGRAILELETPVTGPLGREGRAVRGPPALRRERD